MVFSASDLASNTGDFNLNASELSANTDDLPEALNNSIKALTPKARKAELNSVPLPRSYKPELAYISTESGKQ